METKIHDPRGGKGKSLQYGVNHIQRNGAEHKHKFKGFGHTRQKDRQRRREKDRTVAFSLVLIHTAEHGKSYAEKQTRSADHLPYLESGGNYRRKQIVVGNRIPRVFKIDQVGDPRQPQRVLSEHGRTCVDPRLYHVRAAEGRVIHGDRQHMVQTEGQQKPLQRSVNKGSENRRGVGGIRDPYAKGIDPRLHHGPYHGKPKRYDDRPEDHHQRHEALAVKEGKRVGQLAEVVILIIENSTEEARDNTDEHAHIQGGRA